MTSYITITDAETDPSAPLTSELAKKWRDNPIAISEGSAGAPKIKMRAFSSGALAATATFTGLGNYGGLTFNVVATENAGSTLENVTFEYSNDGSTWSTPIVIGTVIDNLNACMVNGHFDFSTGVFQSISLRAPGAITVVDTTLAGASLAIVAVRFACVDGVTAIIQPNGGTV